jgi:hypothetical protein
MGEINRDIQDRQDKKRITAEKPLASPKARRRQRREGKGVFAANYANFANRFCRGEAGLGA